MAVRPLAPTDFEGWASLYYERYEEIERNPELGILRRSTPPTLEEERTYFEGLLRDLEAGRAVAVVAVEDGRIVGNCALHNLPHAEDGHVAYLGIAVSERYRGRGIGTELLRAALAQAEARFEVIHLNVFEINRRAIALYERFGFRTFGVSHRSMRRGDRYFDERHMELLFDPRRTSGNPKNQAD